MVVPHWPHPSQLGRLAGPKKLLRPKLCLCKGGLCGLGGIRALPALRPIPAVLCWRRSRLFIGPSTVFSLAREGAVAADSQRMCCLALVVGCKYRPWALLNFPGGYCGGVPGTCACCHGLVHKTKTAPHWYEQVSCPRGTGGAPPRCVRGN